MNLVTPLTVALQAPLPMGFSRQEHWSGLPFPSPRDLPDPRIKPRSPALQADSLPLSYERSPAFWVVSPQTWAHSQQQRALDAGPGWDLVMEHEGGNSRGHLSENGVSLRKAFIWLMTALKTGMLFSHKSMLELVHSGVIQPHGDFELASLLSPWS